MCFFYKKNVYALSTSYVSHDFQNNYNTTAQNRYLKTANCLSCSQNSVLTL